jgi:hydrogenase/urease accessory protein HupE
MPCARWVRDAGGNEVGGGHQGAAARSRWRIAGLRIAAVCLVLAACMFDVARAHEALPGLLELREQADGAYGLVWKQPVGVSGPAPVAPVFPEGCWLDGRADASVGSETRIRHGTISCAGGLAGRPIVIAGLELTGAAVLVRLRHIDGRIENHVLRPASPRVTLNAGGGALSTTLSYLRLGIEHILVGVDHLVFVWGLMLLLSGWRRLLQTITAFTVAHSATLALAVLGVVNVPLPPLNVVIGLSILFLGPEVLRAARGQSSLMLRHPEMAAMVFGLLHGIGFASGLSTAGLPREEIPMALLAFNVGVELGQLAFVALVLGVTQSWRVLEIQWSRRMALVPGYVLGVLGAFWTLDRSFAMFGALP